MRSWPRGGESPLGTATNGWEGLEETTVGSGDRPGGAASDSNPCRRRPPPSSIQLAPSPPFPPSRAQGGEANGLNTLERHDSPPPLGKTVCEALLALAWEGRPVAVRGVLWELDFCFVKDRPKGPPTANHQPPPTAKRCQPPTANRHEPWLNI